MAKNGILKKGTKVMWSGSWNTEPEKEVTILGVYQGEFVHDKEGEKVDEVDFEKRETCTFDLDNGHWCYGDQIHYITCQPDEEPEKEYRISFRAEVYVKGKDLKSAKDIWEDIPLFSADALEDYGAEFIELQSVERVDDESYEDVTTEFKRN